MPNGSENTWIYVVGFLVMIVVVNLGLVGILRSKGTREQFDIFRKAGKELRRPFAREDQMLDELSKRVSELKNPAANGRAQHQEKTAEE